MSPNKENTYDFLLAFSSNQVSVLYCFQDSETLVPCISGLPVRRNPTIISQRFMVLENKGTPATIWHWLPDDQYSHFKRVLYQWDRQTIH